MLDEIECESIGGSPSMQRGKPEVSCDDASNGDAPMGNVICSQSHIWSTMNQVACNVEAVELSLNRGASSTHHLQIDSITATIGNQNDIDLAVASALAKSLSNGVERDILRMPSGVSFGKKENRCKIILHSMFFLFDTDTVNDATEIFSAAMPPFRSRTASLPSDQALSFVAQELCVSAAAVEVAAAADHKSAFSLSFRSLEYHYQCSCSADRNGCAHIKQIGLEVVNVSNKAESFRTPISRDIDLEIMATPDFRRLSLVLESAITLSLSFAIIALAQKLLAKIQQQAFLFTKRTSDSTTCESHVDLMLRFSSIAVVITGHTSESVTLTVAQLHMSNSQISIGNVALLFSDREATSSILSCVSTPVVSISISSRSIFIELTTFRVGVPLKLIQFLALFPSFDTLANPQPTAVANSKRLSSLRVLLPLFEIRLHEHVHVLAMMQISDIFLLVLPTVQEDDHVYSCTKTLRCNLSVIVADTILLQQSLISFEQISTVKELSKISSSYPNCQKDWTSLTTDSLDIQLYPEQIIAMQALMQTFNSLKTVHNRKDRLSGSLSHVSSHDDLRSFHIHEILDQPKPGQVTFSDDEITWCYLATRCVTHVSLGTLHIPFQATLTLSAVDIATNERIVVDQIRVDLNRATAHQVVDLVFAEIWIISWTDTPLLTSGDLVQILRIDSISGPCSCSFTSLFTPSFALTLSSRRDGLEADHAIVSVEELSSTMLNVNCFAVIQIRIHRIAASVYRYSDLSEVPFVLIPDANVLICSSSNCSVPITAVMLRNHKTSLFVKFSLPKKSRINVSSYGTDALLYAVELFREAPSNPSSSDTITFATNTTRPHHCSQILLRNNSGVVLHYRQEGQLIASLLPLGEVHNFTWPSIARQQLRLSCHPGLWSEPFALKDGVTIKLYLPGEFTTLHLKRDQTLYTFDAHLHVASQISFPLSLKIVTFQDDDDEDVENPKAIATYSVMLLPESESKPLPLWLPTDRSVFIEYYLRPCANEVEWLWSSLSETSLTSFQSVDGKCRSSVWIRSDGSAVRLTPSVVITNHSESTLVVSCCRSEPISIEAHQSVPFYNLEENIELRAALGIEAIAASESSFLKLPLEGKSVATCVVLSPEQMAVAIATLVVDQGFKLELFSSVTVHNLTSQPLILLDRNNDAIQVATNAAVSAFWPNPVEARFHIVDCDAVLRSQQLHCKRSGSFDVDLCSAVKLSVIRIAMSVNWTASSSSKAHDASSRCDIIFQSRYYLHNRCPFRITIRPELAPPDQVDIITVLPGATQDIWRWPLTAPPIEPIRKSPSFEAGAWLPDNSSLRLTRGSDAEKNAWGWSMPIACFSADSRQQRALFKLRNRQLGYDIVLSCIRCREENITHLLVINDVQVPLLLVNATPHKLSYCASPHTSPPSNINFIKSDVDPHQSAQIVPAMFEEERIFFHGAAPTSLHVRAAGTDWSPEPVLLRDGVSSQILELAYVSPGAQYSSQAHMLGNPPAHSIKRDDKALLLEIILRISIYFCVPQLSYKSSKVDCHDRNGTLVAVIGVKQISQEESSTSNDSSRLELTLDSFEVCFSIDSDITAFVLILDHVSICMDQQFEQRCARILKEIPKNYVPRRSFTMRFDAFQLEHISSPVEFPVVAHNADSSFEIRIDVGTRAVIEDGGDGDQQTPIQFMMESVHIEKFGISVPPFRLFIEDSFILTAKDFFDELMRSIFKMYNRNPTQSVDQRWQANFEFVAVLNNLSKPRFAVHSLCISTIEFRLTYSGQRHYLACQSVPIALESLELVSVLSATDRLIKELSANYLADVIMIAPVLFGSMDLLGNPTQLIGSISRGIGDLVRLPTRAFTQGPKALAWAMLQGVGSLVHNLSEGTLTSVSGFTHSLAHNVAGVSPDHYHLFEPNRSSGAVYQRGISKGLINGANSLATGVVLGVTGVVSAPIRGVARQGAWGFVKGVGAGLAGLVTKPVSGVLDMVSETSRGIAASAGLSPTLPPLKFRQKSNAFDYVFCRISTLRLKALLRSFKESYKRHHTVDAVLDSDGALLYESAILLCSNATVHIIAPGSDQIVQSINCYDIKIDVSGNDIIQIKRSGSILIQFQTSHAIRQSFINCIFQTKQLKPY